MGKSYNYYKSIDDAKTGTTVYVTPDFAKLKEKWAESELGKIDEEDMKSYCCCPGKILEIEEDDDTVMLEWLTKDTQWIPIEACLVDLDKSERLDAPFQVCEMMNEPAALDYYKSIEEVKNGQSIYVTTDFKILKKLWKECELGAMEDQDLEIYLGCPGKILEIEEDDDTVNLEWLTKDTQWMPIEACVKDLPEDQRRDAPFQVCEMVNEPQPMEYFTDIETAKTGTTVYVTTDFKLLKKQWKECELGKITDEDMETYCGCPGKILQVEEDDDTVQLEWLTKDTQWIPYFACVKDVDPKLKRDAPYQVCEIVNEKGEEGADTKKAAEAADSNLDHELIESEKPVVEV